MEYGRFQQVEDLKSAGWTTDEDCHLLQKADETCGGPTYMLSPDGKVCAVTCGTEEPLSGIYLRHAGSPFSGNLRVVYENGKKIGAQG